MFALRLLALCSSVLSRLLEELPITARNIAFPRGGSDLRGKIIV